MCHTKGNGSGGGGGGGGGGGEEITVRAGTSLVPRGEGEGKTHHLKSLDQPRAQGFFLRKWDEWESALGTRLSLDLLTRWPRLVKRTVSTGAKIHETLCKLV